MGEGQCPAEDGSEVWGPNWGQAWLGRIWGKKGRNQAGGNLATGSPGWSQLEASAGHTGSTATGADSICRRLIQGNGTPLQCSCLENPMDGGAWWAAVHGVAKSRTWLSDFTFTFHFYALEKEMATHSSVLAWRIPGTGESVGLPSMGSHRVGHDWSDLAVAAASS